GVQTCALPISHERDDGSRLLLAPLHVRIQVCPAGHVARVGPGVGLHREELVEGSRLPVGERRQSEHQGLAASGARCRPFPPSTAPPSPPSQGGGTQAGPRQGLSGKCVGPNPGSTPFSLRCRALNTLSSLLG